MNILKFERYFGKSTMAIANRVEFEMNSILQFESVIRGHHVYRDIWTPVKDETVFVWKMNAKKRNHLTSTQLVPSKIMFL